MDRYVYRAQAERNADVIGDMIDAIYQLQDDVILLKAFVEKNDKIINELVIKDPALFLTHEDYEVRTLAENLLKDISGRYLVIPLLAHEAESVWRICYAGID